MFCVECGREGELYEGLCGECFLAKNVFVTIPENIDVEICVHCGARKKKKRWILADDEEFILEIIKENVSCEKGVTDFDVHIMSNFEDERNVDVSVTTFAKVHDLKVKEEHETKVRFKKTVCYECSKREGGYWEAKVQLRSGKRDLDQKELDRALELLDLIVGMREGKDKDAFISKVEKVHGGLDFYLGSKNMGKAIAKKLASEFGGSVTESQKLVGRKDGKNTYRMTYAVRTLDFRVGDFIKLKKRLYRMLSMSSNKVLLLSLDNRENVHFKPEDLEEAKLLGGGELVREMVVVSRSDMEIQVLDPDTLKTVDVILPEGFNAEGDSVKIVKFEEGYFLVGEN
ncbi:MAG: hypothetical protein JSW00_15525 [Thermoplasmata archaeon]|nr:MAG: hypothetical protein JSW00_15525 [Thermoplasmata archaeon]